jgi:hypothetical protein
MTPEEEFAARIAAEEPEDLICTEDITLLPQQHKKKRNRTDYSAVKAKYLLGKRELREDGVVYITDYTLAELAAEFQCYLPNLQRLSGKEKWSLQRAAYRARLKENAENTALNIYLYEGAVADTQAMIATNKLNKIYKMALSRYDNIVEAYDSDRQLDDDERIDIRELKDLLAIGKDLHSLSQQVVKSRSAVVDQDIVKDLKTYKTTLPQQKKADTAEVQKRIDHLQNILKEAKPHVTE